MSERQMKGVRGYQAREETPDAMVVSEDPPTDAKKQPANQPPDGADSGPGAGEPADGSKASDAPPEPQPVDPEPAAPKVEPPKPEAIPPKKHVLSVNLPEITQVYNVRRALIGAERGRLIEIPSTAATAEYPRALRYHSRRGVFLFCRGYEDEVRGTTRASLTYLTSRAPMFDGFTVSQDSLRQYSKMVPHVPQANARRHAYASSTKYYADGTVPSDAVSDIRLIMAPLQMQMSAMAIQNGEGVVTETPTVATTPVMESYDMVLNADNRWEVIRSGDFSFDAMGTRAATGEFTLPEVACASVGMETYYATLHSHAEISTFISSVIGVRGGGIAFQIKDHPEYTTNDELHIGRGFLPFHRPPGTGAIAPWGPIMQELAFYSPWKDYVVKAEDLIPFMPASEEQAAPSNMRRAEPALKTSLSTALTSSEAVNAATTIRHHQLTGRYRKLMIVLPAFDAVTTSMIAMAAIIALPWEWILNKSEVVAAIIRPLNIQLDVHAYVASRGQAINAAVKRPARKSLYTMVGQWIEPRFMRKTFNVSAFGSAGVIIPSIMDTMITQTGNWDVATDWYTTVDQGNRENQYTAATAAQIQDSYRPLVGAAETFPQIFTTAGISGWMVAYSNGACARSRYCVPATLNDDELREAATPIAATALAALLRHGVNFNASSTGFVSGKPVVTPIADVLAGLSNPVGLITREATHIEREMYNDAESVKREKWTKGWKRVMAEFYADASVMESFVFAIRNLRFSNPQLVRRLEDMRGTSLPPSPAGYDLRVPIQNQAGVQQRSAISDYVFCSPDGLPTEQRGIAARAGFADPAGSMAAGDLIANNVYFTNVVEAPSTEDVLPLDSIVPFLKNEKGEDTGKLIATQADSWIRVGPTLIPEVASVDMYELGRSDLTERFMRTRYGWTEAGSLKMEGGEYPHIYSAGAAQPTITLQGNQVVPVTSDSLFQVPIDTVETLRRVADGDVTQNGGAITYSAAGQQAATGAPGERSAIFMSGVSASSFFYMAGNHALPFGDVLLAYHPRKYALTEFTPLTASVLESV